MSDAGILMGSEERGGIVNGKVGRGGATVGFLEEDLGVLGLDFGSTGSEASFTLRKEEERVTGISRDGE